MKCKYCGIDIENPEIFKIHEDNCLEHQKLNGIKKETKLEDMNVQELRNLAKEKSIEGYSNLKRDELINAIKAVE
ncbi:MAG: Rho termination factor N-terminal domain-containing protein [Bacillota bacterium]|nr:Rho termination factor N-terminal domain-containing protein [Bacillota bacterium]